MTITPEALEALSQKATQGEWETLSIDGACYIVTSSGENAGRDEDHILACALVNAYRTGQLVLIDDQAVERVAELQLAAFLAGRGSVTGMKHGTRTAKPAPSMDQLRQMAITALRTKP